MKNLQKLMIVVIALTMATGLYAQKFGVKAGLNMSTMLAKDDEATYSDDFKMSPGFHVGLTAEFPFSDNFSFETGLLLSTKGYKAEGKVSEMGITMDYKDKVNLYYIDVPLTLKGTTDLGGIKLFGNVGPYIGVGISGKDKYELTYGGETVSETVDIKWGSGSDNDLKQLDFGLTVGAGLAFGNIEVGVGYNLGLANISAVTDGGATMKNKVLTVSLGYKFGDR